MAAQGERLCLITPHSSRLGLVSGTSVTIITLPGFLAQTCCIGGDNFSMGEDWNL